jgi:hypothetical protein
MVFVEVERDEILVQHDQRGRMFPALYCRMSGSYSTKLDIEHGDGEYRGCG